MNNESIEFQSITDDPSLPKVVRKAFRVPVEETQKAWVLIDETHYPVLDICLGGISIAIQDNSAFNVGQQLAQCELNLFDESIKGLTGRVVHFSSTREQEWKYGIQWVDMEKETASLLATIISRMKVQLLKEDNISFD